ncbi:MAG: substrate-binding domain-containing protein [Chthoniobacterales bacterium]
MRRRSCIYLIIDPLTRFERGVYEGVARFLSEKFPHFDLFIVSDAIAVDTKQSLKGIITLVTRPKHRTSLLHYGVPIVNVSGYLKSSKLPTVTCDDEGAGRMAAEYLINCRFHHFAYHQHTSGHSFDLRFRGFRNTIMTAGFECNQHEQYDKNLNDFADLNVSQQQNLRKWLISLPKPVGIFSGTDRDAWEIWNMCNALNLKVGKDVGLVGHGNDAFYCETRHPYLSSVENRPDHLGYEAAALLFHLIRGGKPPSQPILVPASGIVPRESANEFLVEDIHVDRAIQFIRRNLEHPQLIPEVFRHVPMSRRTLERRFTQCLGRTLGETIQELKIVRIKHLLNTTSMKLHEIAPVCGFTNIFYMTRLFSKKMGISPAKYRARFQHKAARASVS